MFAKMFTKMFAKIPSRCVSAVAAVALLAPASCTFQRGSWFAEVQANFTGHFVARPDRDAGAGWQKLNTLYETQIARAQLTIASLTLEEFGASGAGGGGRLDPAHPPPDYTLCHNGHCHHKDGRLVPYAEIEAELAGGGTATTSTAVSFPVGAIDLLQPATRMLACEPDCGLGRANIRRARASLTQFALEGLLRDARTPARFDGELRWRWEGTLPAGDKPPAINLDGEIDLPADRKHPPHVTLDAVLEVTARLLDNVDWAALARDADGAIDLALPANTSGRDRLLQNLAESELAVTITRSN